MSRTAPHHPFTIDAWRRRTELPITVAAVVFLVVYTWSVLADVHGASADAAEAVMGAVWLVFVVDYAVTLWLAEHRGRWFVTHLPQFLVVALPMLRPLRLLRLLTLFAVLQRATGTWIRERVTVYVVGSTVLLVFLASLAELEAERHAPGAEIRTFGDAVWWAFETITTVGFGDRVPVTAEGRFIAVGLMLAGIALLGIITATLASWLVERISSGERAGEAVTTAHVDALAGEIRALRAELAALRTDRAVPEKSNDTPS